MRIPLKDGLFTATDDARTARLLAGRCIECGRLNFPAQGICPYCSQPGCETIALGTHGVIEVCTTVVNRPPGYEGPLPFGFGVVELPEGLRVISRITNAQHARPGTPVQLRIGPLCTDADGREVVTYAFEAIVD